MGQVAENSEDPERLSEYSTPLRIAIVTESFLPQVNGVTNSVLRVLEHLRLRGHEALVIAPGFGDSQYCGFPVIRVPQLQLPVLKAQPIGWPSRKIYTALQDFQPDLVHLASPFVVGARGATAARKLGIPTVAVYQTDVAGFAGHYGLGLAERAAWRWTSWLHTMADRTLAPSTWAVDALKERDIPRVYRWGRGVDTVRFSPFKRSAELRKKLAPNGELLVGYVGRLALEKCVNRLAPLGQLPGVRVVVVGDGPELDTMRELLPTAAFLGFQDGEDLAKTYASLDIFVHTGPNETFCQTVQEALASGVPVLAPDAGGPRDLVQPGQTGFLLPAFDETAHAVALCDAVHTLRDAELRARFALQARDSVAARTWTVVCDELLGHYRAALASARSRTHVA